MTLADALSWAAEIASGLSMWAYGTKTIKGPLSGIATNFLWLALGLYSGLTGLVAGAAMFEVIHIYNLWKWSRDC